MRKLLLTGDENDNSSANKLLHFKCMRAAMWSKLESKKQNIISSIIKSFIEVKLSRIKEGF